MERVLVIGCPGAGKTTFALQLAQVTGLPLEHLDYYYHDDKYDYQSNRPAWRDHVTNLTVKDRWIIEGNYKSTFDIRLPRADTIIYLDYPRRITVWRALKRRVQHHRKSRPGMPSSWKEKITPEFARFVWQFNTKQRPLIYKELSTHLDGKNVVVFKQPRDPEEFLENLGVAH